MNKKVFLDPLFSYRVKVMMTTMTVSDDDPVSEEWTRKNVPNIAHHNMKSDSELCKCSFVGKECEH